MKNSDIKNSILYEDEDYVVLNKPEKISTLDDRSSKVNVLSQVRQRLGHFKICHRLDKDTSGVLLIAKNDESYRYASIQFEKRQIKKVYHALVMGNTDFIDQLVDLPIFVSSSPKVRIDVRKGRDSRTIFNTLRNYKGYSFIQCQPITGRKHQIRIHLKYMGHPIAGDLAYGGAAVLLSQLKRNYHFKGEERPLIGRLVLHAFSLEFKSISGKVINVEAPYPSDFKILLRQLDKYAS